jgi:hypothetical protein
MMPPAKSSKCLRSRLRASKEGKLPIEGGEPRGDTVPVREPLRRCVILHRQRERS